MTTSSARAATSASASLLPTNRLDVAGGVSATAFVSTSDRNAKENFAPVAARDVLAKVAALPIIDMELQGAARRTPYRPDGAGLLRRLRPGRHDTTITTVDADGVALAAIQGLNQKLSEELKRRDAENAELKQRLEKLEQLINQKLNGGAR